MREFKEKELKNLFKPRELLSKGNNGQVTIIGGSELFHGAPILALKTASRIAGMVFFVSPAPSIGKVAEKFKSKLFSFIWVPWNEVKEYIKKSDAILIGPGLMRYRREDGRRRAEDGEDFDEVGKRTKRITEELLQDFPDKQWVIDAGSLQVMNPKFIPKNAILTPNKKEFRMLFGGGDTSDGVRMHSSEVEESVKRLAKKHCCIIMAKNAETIVCSSKRCAVVKGGNTGLSKGGIGDVLAGLAVALAAKNPPFLAACSASFIAKKAADELYNKVGFAYNADDLADKIPEVLGKYFR